MRRVALLMAAGTYDIKTSIRRQDEIGQLAGSLEVLAERLSEAKEMRENLEQNRRDFFQMFHMSFAHRLPL